jgi:C4-dicarboxylate transporter DctQ subunit
MRKIEFYMSRLEEILIGFLIASASVILFANVIARYVLNSGIPWADEVVRYQIVWMVFLGGSVAARQGIHIGIDILVQTAPEKIGRIIRLIIHAIGVFFCALLFYFGAELTVQTREFGQVSTALQAPMWMFQLAIPVGGALMAILRISAIVDACFSVIVDGVSEPSWTRRGCAQARG